MPELTPSDLMRHPAWRAGNLLDVRGADDFAAGHLAGSVSIPVPAAALGTGGDGLLAEILPGILLPPRHEPLAVIAADPATARTVARFLAGRGRSRPLVCVLDRGALDALPPAARERGESRGHLWRPPAFLVAHRHLLPPPAAGPVLDLAAGSCRAGVWLAERGHRVTAVDRDPDALDLGARLAASRGVALDLRVGDLRDPAALPAGPWQAVLMFRYLERDVLPRLADVLSPGGILIVRTFRTGTPADHARRHLLRAGELRRLAPAAAFEILVDVEDEEPDGRPAAGLVARRRPPGADGGGPTG